MAEDFMAMYKQALERLSTGGMSLEASLQEIEEGKKQAIAGGQQALVSGGLGGTTVMGGVPLQAEKIASRQRLGARGRAEEKYLTTLASFAAFAQRGEEAEKQRQFAEEQALKEMQSREFMELTGRMYAGSEAKKQRGWETEQARLGREFGGGGGYAEQFPSIYGQEGTAVPDWTGDAGAGIGTGAGAGAGAGAGGGYTPQTGDYMSVTGGPGGPILDGGQTGVTQKTTYKKETKGGQQVMGMYINGRRVGSLTMEQYAAQSGGGWAGTNVGAGTTAPTPYGTMYA